MLNNVPANMWKTQLEGAFLCKCKIVLLGNLCSPEISIPSHTHFVSPFQQREKAVRFILDI